jgi:hypothetical protein
MCSVTPATLGRAVSPTRLSALCQPELGPQRTASRLRSDQENYVAYQMSAVPSNLALI